MGGNPPVGCGLVAVLGMVDTLGVSVGSFFRKIPGPLMSGYLSTEVGMCIFRVGKAT